MNTPVYVGMLVSPEAWGPLTNAERVVQTNYWDWGAPIIVGLHICAGAGTVIIRPRDIRDASRYRVYLEGCSAITNNNSNNVAVACSCHGCRCCCLMMRPWRKGKRCDMYMYSATWRVSIRKNCFIDYTTGCSNWLFKTVARCTTPIVVLEHQIHVCIHHALVWRWRWWSDDLQ